MTSQPARTRIAPSPTGDPHVGTAYQAVFNRALAQRTGGRFLLRIEDTDRARLNPDSEAMIYRALRWLGLEADESPEKGGPHAPYRQSERLPIYAEHALVLLEKGVAYRCFCTADRLEKLKAAQNAAKQPPRYDRLCAAIPPEEAAARAATEPHVVRLRVPSEGETVVRDGLRAPIAFENALIDDQVLLKSDGYPTYHLAVVVDDHLMGVTHVIRGEEWLPSTPKHLLLYAAFGWEPPAHFHTPLLRNADRSKLSKRRNPTSLDWYRERGYLPEALVNFLCSMGWSHPGAKDMYPWEEFVALFTPEAINLGGPIFDLDKLAHLNGLWIRSFPVEEIERRLVEGGFTKHAAADPALRRAAVTQVHDRLVLLTDFDDLTAFFFEDVAPKVEDLAGKQAPAAIREALAAMRGALARAPEWTHAEIETAVRGVTEASAVKKKDLFMSLRVALTGRTVSTPLFETMAAIGRSTTLARLDAAIALLPEGSPA